MKTRTRTILRWVGLACLAIVSFLLGALFTIHYAEDRINAARNATFCDGFDNGVQFGVIAYFTDPYEFNKELIIRRARHLFQVNWQMQREAEAAEEGK